MKTFTFIMCFVAILGLIEANWTVLDKSSFSRNDVNKFLPLVRRVLSTTGDDFAYKMELLKTKMQQNWPGTSGWSCVYGDLWAAITANISIEISNGNAYILCFAGRWRR